MKTFIENFADKNTAISELNFWENTFAYAVFDKEQNKKNKYIISLETADHRKSKLYIAYTMLLK